MGIFELFSLALGLSMDAFAVSICKGLATESMRPRHMVIVGLWFGGSQALMPLVGYFLGAAFQKYITAVDHWVAFALLAIIGGRMVWGALRHGAGEEEDAPPDLSARRLCLLAIATSIDALAVGVSMAFMNVPVLLSAVVIGVVAFVLSLVGGLVGKRLGSLFQRRAELVGGLVLIAIGVKILIEHLSGG